MVNQTKLTLHAVNFKSWTEMEFNHGPYNSGLRISITVGNLLDFE